MYNFGCLFCAYFLLIGGRVLEEEDTSDIWHYNYGGGFWFAPVDVLTFSFGAFQPREAFEEEGLSYKKYFTPKHNVFF